LTYLGFKTEGKLAAVLITPSLGVPNWPVIYIINTTPPPMHQTSFLRERIYPCFILVAARAQLLMFKRFDLWPGGISHETMTSIPDLGLL
jgi:hypothetical protein